MHCCGPITVWSGCCTHPAMVERQNCSLLKFLRVRTVNGESWKDEIQTFLLAYRAIPHSATGKSPFELMCGSIHASGTAGNMRDIDWSKKLSAKPSRRTKLIIHPCMLSVVYIFIFCFLLWKKSSKKGRYVVFSDSPSFLQ